MATPILLAAQQLTQGGSERQLVETAKTLDRTRFEPHVAVLRPGGVRIEELRNANIPVTCFPVTSFASPKVFAAARAIGAYLHQHHIQLVHAFDTPANLFVIPVARFYRTPVVLSSQRAYRTLTRGSRNQLLRLIDRLVDGVVVNCRALERHLTEDERVPPSHIHLCYNGIDTSIFHRRPKQQPESLRDATLVVGVVCALRPEKGLETLVEAFANARTSVAMKLLIVGSGPMLQPLQDLSSSLGCTQDVLFEPTTAAVTDWLSALDIFILPSLSEAFSNSLMEAMACGCTVIASNVGGNSELVEHGVRGLLFEPGNSTQLAKALIQLAEDSDFRQRLAVAGHDFIHQNFPSATAAATMGSIYASFLQK